ncbi:MAG: hypothetical protein JWP57_2107 [Spirosoma sp.]|nr:hypothetical protein [Spirosoma sp.]
MLAALCLRGVNQFADCAINDFLINRIPTVNINRTAMRL